MTETADLARRRAPRVALAVRGSLSHGRSIVWDVGVVDVSVSGCLVSCPKALAPGEILDFRLPLDGHAVVAKVQVADSSVDGAASPGDPRFLVGLRFFQLPARDEAKLRIFIDAQRRRTSA